MILAVAALAGCGLLLDSATGPQDRLPDSAPTLAASDSISPAEGSGERTDLVGGVSVEVPKAWTVEAAEADEDRDVESRVLRADGGTMGLPAVSVHVDKSPPNSVNDESFIFGSTSALSLMSEFERVTLEWPGAREAVLATWVENVDGRDTDCAAIFAARGNQLIMANAFAFVDEGGLEDSAALAILLSLKL